jgi:hypothetical protein
MRPAIGRSGAAASFTGGRGGHGKGLFASAGRFLERERNLGLKIFPALLPGFPPHAIPEEVTEDVAKMAEDILGGIEAAEARFGLDLRLAAAIVSRSRLGVVKDVVGPRDPLEILLGRLVARIAIRVVPGRQFPEGVADFLGGGVAGNPKFGIIIAFGHSLLVLQSPQLKPKDTVFISGLQEFHRAGERDITEQDTPFDLAVKEQARSGGALGTDDESGSFERDIDIGFDHPGHGDFEKEIVLFFHEIENEVEKRLIHEYSTPFQIRGPFRGQARQTLF